MCYFEMGAERQISHGQKTQKTDFLKILMVDQNTKMFPKTELDLT
jgi:hypothetical protein